MFYTPCISLHQSPGWCRLCVCITSFREYHLAELHDKAPQVFVQLPPQCSKTTESNLRLPHNKIHRHHLLTPVSTLGLMPSPFAWGGPRSSRWQCRRNIAIYPPNSKVISAFSFVIIVSFITFQLTHNILHLSLLKLVGYDQNGSESLTTSRTKYTTCFDSPPPHLILHTAEITAELWQSLLCQT